jgi:phenylacetate-CoA ligase
VGLFCLHEGERIVDVLGRVGSSVKVKGMFVHENQLADVLGKLGYEVFQATVTRKDGQDMLEVFVESDEEVDEDLVTKVKEVIRVTPVLTKVAKGTLEKVTKRLVVLTKENGINRFHLSS